jgi:D-amino-acid dehydrogenase
VPLKALKWLFGKHSPLVIKPGLDPRQYLWLARLLRNCTAHRYAINKARMLRLARYSSACLDDLREEWGLDYEGRRLGTVQLFRTQSQLDAAAHDIAVLQHYGVPYELLDRAGIVKAEPALAGVVERFTGALRLPGDQTGDCALFTRSLAERAKAAGVEFRFNARVEALETSGDRITGARINGRIERADRYVLALGSYTPRLLAPLGIRLPVYPLKGYSLTVPITDPAMAPSSTVLDESYKVAVTRFDARIRVGGTAEVCGFDLSKPARRRATLEKVLADLYPRGGDLDEGEFWAGLRPATPDGTPVVGATPFANLYLNTGHGTLGWTMACGSGRYLADLMAGAMPQISGEGLDISRYRRANRNRDYFSDSPRSIFPTRS